MKHYQFQLFLILFFFTLSFNANAQKNDLYPKTEFRGVWIATVVNIDWPKTSTDSVAKQKEDYLEILETYKKLNYNAVIVQIRSVGDAFYPTDLAPWSRYLTGKEGQEPKPYYDTLAWMITEAHSRGFEFHAWLNPYRATFDTKIETLSPKHDYFKHPNWMIKYGEVGKEKYYYNPGLPEVQSHLLKVVDEVVKKYDIDAIHFDDYFYPYRVKGKEFNDSNSYKKYGNGLSIEDWRRANVNTFVKSVYQTIKKEKPWVQFGISPFGVWRNKSVDPKGSDTQAGQTNYDDLFADPLAWMEEKYIDYMLPQLYWSIDHKTASYFKLLKWWSENTINTNLYIGNSSYKINADSDTKWNNPMEIPNQIDLTRTYKNVQGNAYFSAKSLLDKNATVTQLLQENQYKYPALPPVVPSAKKTITTIPVVASVSREDDNCIIRLKDPVNLKIRYGVVYGSNKTSKLAVNDPKQIIGKFVFEDNILCVPIKSIKNIDTLGVTFIDYFGNESNLTNVPLPKEVIHCKSH